MPATTTNPLSNPTFRIRQFRYLADIRTFVAEASDLGLGGMPQQFTLVSDRTGKAIAFHAVAAGRDDDNDLFQVTYHGDEGEFRAVVFND